MAIASFDRIAPRRYCSWNLHEIRLSIKVRFDSLPTTSRRLQLFEESMYFKFEPSVQVKKKLTKLVKNVINIYIFKYICYENIFYDLSNNT